MGVLKQAGECSTEDFDDIFGSMFNGHRRRGSDASMQGQDERYTLMMDFIDMVVGATRRLTLPDARTLDVKIPPGSTDGQVLQLRGPGVSTPLNNGPFITELLIAAKLGNELELISRFG